MFDNPGLIIHKLLFILVFTVTAFSQDFGKALEFDGLDDFVFVGNDSTLYVNQFTLTSWVHPYSYSGPIPNEQRMEILEKAGEYWMNISTTDGGFQRDIGEVRVGGIFGDENTWHFLDSEYVVPLNEWTHVACTYDNDSLRLYINGQLDVAKAIPENYTAQKLENNMLALGCKNVSGPLDPIEAQFHGQLDEISIWDIALSENDIQHLMQSGIEISHPYWGRLLAYYKFDEDNIAQNDSLAYDEKGLNNGDNYGAVWVSNLLITDIEEKNFHAQQFVLKQNYPNPFNPVTNIQFSIPHASDVRLNIYNITGQHVTELINDRLNGGTYNVKWHASNLSSGVYFYKIQAGDFSQFKKCMLIK